MKLRLHFTVSEDVDVIKWPVPFLIDLGLISGEMNSNYSSYESFQLVCKYVLCYILWLNRIKVIIYLLIN